ncbi:MAG: hypothetical protein ACT4ON_09460 [Bacteroidota bacterium]
MLHTFCLVLYVKYKFTLFPFIVADAKGNFYQLPHCTNKYTKNYRKLTLMLNNGVTPGYRINRQFVSLKQLRKLACIVNETITIQPHSFGECPF